MLSFVKCGLGFLIRFFFRSVQAAMRCFFGFRDNSRHHLPEPLLVSTAPSPSTTTDTVISENRLCSLLWKENGDSARNAADEVSLNDEAKFLQACGAIARTPPEIRETSAKLKVSPACESDSDTSRFHSWLPNTSVEKLQLDVHSFEHTPSSFVFKAQDPQYDSPDYVEGSWTRSPHTAYKTRKNEAWTGTETQKKNKSVRFESGNDLVSYQSPPVDGDVQKNKSLKSQTASNQSPDPTPLKLFDEMQTPGTVYPTSLDDLCDGKRRVRSQFVYTNCNAGENLLLTKLLEVQGFNPEHDSSELGVSVEQEHKLEASLSSWLEPASINMEEGNWEMESGADFEILQSADTPNIGVVPAQLNEDEDSHFVSPKRPEVNGIPNTTKKYKEDQTVKWHATPFEERLDKALSEEKHLSQRKLAFAKPMAFEDIEE
ncbi:unnamed protein product [Lathyrus sativus]|nr:unnamed protein product [Lathyrus sativus]